MGNIIEIVNLEFTYKDGTKALKGISLEIPRGSKVALLGPNGAGKSTLLLHMNGINLPQTGSVKVSGMKVDRDNEHKIKSLVGLVFQDPDDQVFSATVWDDVAFGPLNMGVDGHELELRVEEALKIAGMWDYRDKAPHHLSYGQKKRVAIAGILAMEPEVVIMDEPMAYLDPKGQEDLFEILQEIHREGKTIILATHDMDMAAEWADLIIIIKDGRVLAQGTTDLLTDEGLVAEANLRLPLVTRIFRKLPELNLSTEPKTVKEAAEVIKSLLRGGPVG